MNRESNSGLAGQDKPTRPEIGKVTNHLVRLSLTITALLIHKLKEDIPRA